MDDVAASPLTVIGTVLVVAILVTAGIAYLVDEPEPEIDVKEADGGFVISKVSGELDWSELQVQLLDPSGADVTERWLNIPTGAVAEGQSITWKATPYAGSYQFSIVGEYDVFVSQIVQF